jgi:hypothetical protein
MLQQRGEGDVWNGLFQFYVLEQDRMPVFSDNYLETVLKHQFGLSQKQWKYIGADQQPKLYKQVLQSYTTLFFQNSAKICCDFDQYCHFNLRIQHSLSFLDTECRFFATIPSSHPQA